MTYPPRTLALIAAVALLLVLPAIAGPFTIALLADTGIATLVTLGLVLLTGVGGMTSFGQAAFVGIAAYASAWLSTATGLSPWLGLFFALTLTGLSALAIGLLTLRLGGHFLPLSTIAWGLSIAIAFGNIDALGRHTGLTNIPPLHIGPWSLANSQAMYYLIWIVLGVMLLLAHNLLHSRPGRAIRALRGGTTLLASVGADAFHVRLGLFVAAALLAGLAGWLYAHLHRFVSPSPFDVRASIEYLLMALAGGMGHLAGAVLGAGVVLLLKSQLQDVLPHLTQRAGQIETIVFAALFIVLVHFARGGIMGFVLRHRKSGAQETPTNAAHSAAATLLPLPRRSLPERGIPVLSVQGAVKRFGGLTAVNEVGFTVCAGEIVGLIGPNGAGKSTLFNLLTATVPMTAGQVHFLGHDITGLSQRAVARLGLARTFQHVKLRPQMSLLDNVALGCWARTQAGMLRASLHWEREEERRAQHEARQQLQRLGLGALAHSLAGNLPLGSQRMVEIARALAADPVLLILDEPAAGLRRQEKQALAAVLGHLRAEGVTILIVEHDMEFVMNLVDRLVVMNFGCKLTEGIPAAVRADARVQAAYLGSSTESAP